MEIDNKTKEALKNERLEQYKRQIFSHQMNYEACKSIDDKEGMENTTKHIEALEKAYKAIEAM